jgi:hypothetical protein
MDYNKLRGILHSSEKLSIRYLKSEGIKVNSKQLERLNYIKSRHDVLMQLILPVYYGREEVDYVLDKMLDVDNYNDFKFRCMAGIVLKTSCKSDKPDIEYETIDIERIKLAIESNLSDEKYQIILYALNDSIYTKSSFIGLSVEELKYLIKYAEKKTTLLQVKRMLRKLRYSTK